ncbi:uncharacterized protein LOC123499210 isoform X2 [Portunus trituberculatus]|uniref:uncharacterized protein LOC123499210 isoform X2 n=1 Tax=Portunus trituberculatus TaxID=210409 RepID=UPI001E1CC289|nr:uncharacterized protein LOC123499210 isoform X2 [Portunus trituberculatus]
MAGSKRLWFNCCCVLLAALLRRGCCVCYFPGELQGVWETQVTSEGGAGGGGRGAAPFISYQSITIHSDAVQEWGTCWERLDSTVILADSTGASQCFRCVNVRLVAAQVLQVWTPGLQTCYTTKEAAYQTCPTPDQIVQKRATLLMLYKSRSVWGDKEVRVVGCPFDGRYTFTYQRAGGAEGACPQPTSEISNCPLGFGYNVTYRDCSFSPVPISRGLQCLGSWLGEDNINYLAVRDTSATPDQPHLPRFRCGMFKEEAGTARVYLALSNDTTCTNGLYSPTNGHETYVLTSVPAPPLPPIVSASPCAFPRSLQGHWHHTYVGSDTALFRDYINHKTYSVSCIEDMNDGERFLVYARTHCGEWSYNCFWMKRRSANILEHMLGRYPKETFDRTLCDPRNFGDKTSWITQGKSLVVEPTSCPIVGRYTGDLPDSSGICAELYSDCASPNYMSFTVAECRNNSVVYEQSQLAGPTSEAGPWVPPEQQVSTGAVLTFVQDARVPRRGRQARQASGGQFRVANARTTTISWLWGTPATPFTTTTTTTSTTTTTASPATSRSRFHPVPTWRRPLSPVPPEDRFPVQGSGSGSSSSSTFSPSPPQPSPPFNRGLSPIGFWPNNPEVDTRPLPPGAGVAGVPSPVVEPPPLPEGQSEALGVPGRATWVPGAPPGFHSSPNTTESSSSQESAAGVAGPVVVPSPGPLPPNVVSQLHTSQRTLKQEREYQCLGQWTEDKRIYALTFRRDIRTYECFVGVIRPDGTVFIKEAESEAGCSRDVQPEVLGMKLRKEEECPDGSRQPFTSIPQSSQRSSSSRPTPRPTKPWKPITGRPRARGSGGGGTISPSTSLLCLSILTLFASLRSLAGGSSY